MQFGLEHQQSRLPQLPVMYMMLLQSLSVPVSFLVLRASVRLGACAFACSATRSACHVHGCRVQQLMLSNTVVKISSLVIVALPAVLIGGEIYSAITGQPATNGFIKIYSVLLMIPGVALM